MSNNPSILDADIHILKLHTKEEQILKDTGIKTIGELICYSEDDLLSIKGIGNKTIEAICFQLKRYNLHLSKEGKSIKYNKNTFEGKIYYTLISLVDKEIVMEKYDEFTQKCNNLSLKAVPPLNENETCYLREKTGIITASNMKWLSRDKSENELIKIFSLKLAMNFLSRKNRVISLNKKPEQITGEELNRIVKCVNYSHKLCNPKEELPSLHHYTNRTIDEFISLFRLRLNDNLKAILECYQNIKNQGCSFKDEEELINIYSYDETEREKDIEKADLIPISSLDSISNETKSVLTNINYKTVGDLLRSNTWKDELRNLQNNFGNIQVDFIIQEIHNRGFCLPEETKCIYVEKSILEAITINDLGLYDRLYNNLYRLGLMTVGQITALSLKELSEYRTMRQKDVYNLYCIIHELGLSFKDEDKYNLDNLFKSKRYFKKVKVIKVEQPKTKEELEQQNLQKEKEELLLYCQYLNDCCEQEKQKIREIEGKLREIEDELRETLSELASKTSKEEFSEMKKCFVIGDSNE